METLFTIILILHIAGGTLALLAAPVAMITHKGGNRHRLAGKLFYWGMADIFLTSIYMSIYHNIPFLLMVAFFSFHMATSGYRSLYYKKLHLNQPIKLFDWIILSVAALCNFIMLGWGLYQWLGMNSLFGIVAIVFAATGLGYVWRDWRKFNYKFEDKNVWLFNHIAGMIGAYLAAVTAFLVVNFNSLPFYITWLGPAIIGTPLVTWFIYYYRKKLNGPTKVKEVTAFPEHGLSA